VTEADRAVEQLLRDELHARRPADAIVGEEFGSEGSAQRRWILDPIDGTKNYVRGVPVWSTLIALADGDDVIVGVGALLVGMVNSTVEPTVVPAALVAVTLK